EIKFEPSVMCELIDRAASFRANQEMDARNRPSERFTWKISNFSKLTSRTYYSEVFTVAGCKWRITIFPKGNNTDFVSIYLDVPDYASLPIGWSRTVDFSLTVVNQNCRDTSIRKGTLILPIVYYAFHVNYAPGYLVNGHPAAIALMGLLP
ncbi:hypothetical protein CRG98_050045, partial [Punica granatum]